MSGSSVPSSRSLALLAWKALALVTKGAKSCSHQETCYSLHDAGFEGHVALPQGRRWPMPLFCRQPCNEAGLASEAAQKRQPVMSAVGDFSFGPQEWPSRNESSEGRTVALKAKGGKITTQTHPSCPNGLAGHLSQHPFVVTHVFL